MLNVETSGPVEIRKAGLRVAITIDGETADASATLWRAVLFDMRIRERLRSVVTRDLVKPIEAGVCWWNGDGR